MKLLLLCPTAAANKWAKADADIAAGEIAQVAQAEMAAIGKEALELELELEEASLTPAYSPSLLMKWMREPVMLEVMTSMG